jgi:hypothetical protein
MNARPEFVSDVFWERMVSTSSVIASSCGRHTGRPYRAESLSTISAGDSGGVFVLVLATVTG